MRCEGVVRVQRQEREREEGETARERERERARARERERERKRERERENDKRDVRACAHVFVCLCVFVCGESKDERAGKGKKGRDDCKTANARSPPTVSCFSSSASDASSFAASVPSSGRVLHSSRPQIRQTPFRSYPPFQPKALPALSAPCVLPSNFSLLLKLF